MTIPTLLNLLQIASLACWIGVRRHRKSLFGTNLTTAFALLDTGVWTWCLMPLLPLITGIQEVVVDYGRYVAILLVLGGGISVLGARRPGSEAWRWFVVVPMFLVLGWPALLCWGNEWTPRRLELMTPAFLGSLLVIIMAAGNYLTTRWQCASLLGGIGAMLFLLNRTTLVPVNGMTQHLLGLGIEVLVFCSIVSVWRNQRTTSREMSGIPRFWSDFRDFFGIVWAYRVMERMNQEAQRLNWPFRFEIDRIVTADSTIEHSTEVVSLNPGDLTEKVVEEVRFHLEWLFRRFVTDEWRDARLGNEWKKRDKGLTP